jgi:shikimate kinase
MHIYLTGFMGSGKTTVGGCLAARLGLPFVDLDQAIEARACRSIRQIFDEVGEPGFRSLEHEVMTAVAAGPPAVVATGGGTVTASANLRLIETTGISVWLNPPFATISKRIGALGKADRPLFKDEMQALALYRDRIPAYRKADFEVAVAPAESAEEVAARIALLVRARSCAT